MIAASTPLDTHTDRTSPLILNISTPSPTSSLEPNASSTERPLRVLVLSHNFPNPASPQEAGFMADKLGRLAAAGVSLRVVCPAPVAPPIAWGSRMKAARRRSRALPQQWSLHGIPVYYPRYWKLPGKIDFGLFGPLYYRGIRKFVRRLYEEEPFDLIHGQWLVPDGYAAGRIGRELGAASVSTEQGYVSRYPDRGPRAAAMRRAIRGVDQIVTVSQALADRVNQFAAPRRPVRVVYPGVDIDRFQHANADAARRGLGLPAGKYMVCCARLEAIKQPKLVFDVFQRVHAQAPDTHLVWVGDGSQRSLVQQQAHEAGLAQQVHLPGAVPHDEVPKWLAAANVVVLMSRHEGLSLALAEASATSRPVVATQVGGIPEVIVSGQTGLLRPHDDAQGLAGAVLQLLNDEALAEQMGRAGRQHACERFSWSRYAQQMVDVYREAAARK